MREPVWLAKEPVLALHDMLLAEFGGLAGIRDEGLLDSALERPRHLQSYGKPTLFELAAAYAFGIVRNHPFLDGNKRTGFVAAALVLDINGYELLAEEADATIITLGFAAGDIKEAKYADWLKELFPASVDLFLKSP